MLYLWMALASAADVQAPVLATVRLPSSPGLFDRWDAERSFGSRLTVDTLMSATRRLAWEHPTWDPLTIGDLSNRGGGPMFGHSTHDEGIDADIGLFIDGGRQQDGFVDVRPGNLDAEATWALIAALLDTGNVQFILLDQRHINVLRDHLATVGYPPEAIDEVFVSRATRLSADRRGIVRHAPNHRSHLHVRITPAPPPRPVN